MGKGVEQKGGENKKNPRALRRKFQEGNEGKRSRSAEKAAA